MSNIINNLSGQNEIVALGIDFGGQNIKVAVIRANGSIEDIRGMAPGNSIYSAYFKIQKPVKNTSISTPSSRATPTPTIWRPASSAFSGHWRSSSSARR